jgi:cobalt-zinc-cadmium efflux system protein
MPHEHSHHHHIDAATGDRRLFWAVAVNMGLTVAQVIGGLVSGSLALIADALHNFSDAVALIIAVVARRIARRPASEAMNFGYGRAEVVAALVNYTTLVVLALYLIYEGILRLFDPQPIDGWLVVWIAAIALVVDLVTAALTWAMSKDSMNIRAAFLHNLADALGSVAVIVAGTLVIVMGWVWVDPLVTLMIAGYILWHVQAEIGGVIRVLMLGRPPQIEAEAVARAIEGLPGVQGVHNLRLWSVQEHEAAFEAHLVIAAGAWGRADRIKAGVKALLADGYGIHHSTLELECAVHVCPDADRIGGY